MSGLTLEIANKAIAAVYFMALAVSVGCATPHKPSVVDVRIDPAQQYKYFLNQEGLKIAVDPFFEEDRIRLYFGGDLLSRGILPVLIVVENEDQRSGYLLEKNSIQLQDSQQGAPNRSASDREPTFSYAVRPFNLLDILMVAPSTIPAAVRTARGDAIATKPDVSDDVVREINTINENVRKKAFADRTIFPQEKHSGFVYFKMKSNDDIKNISAIIVKARNIRSDKEVSFDFRLQK